MSEPEHIGPKRIRPEPIRSESLRPRRLEHIMAVFDVFGRHMNLPLEQFEIEFMRDMDPKSELDFWRNITSAWIISHEKFDKNKVPKDDEKELVTALTAICSRVEDV